MKKNDNDVKNKRRRTREQENHAINKRRQRQLRLQRNITTMAGVRLKCLYICDAYVYEKII
jgi:ppGpp synthetase/RelA/SpoT-type nucleotidyltranferase